MAMRIESFAREEEERRLREEIKMMKPEKRKKYLEREATMYLNMVLKYSSDKRLMEKKEQDKNYLY